ncbi:Spliceosome-associated protein 49, partial [Cryomyces antarcticus]
MRDQYLNTKITVQYAYEDDGKGERHGSKGERLIAVQADKQNIQPTTQPWCCLDRTLPIEHA